MRGSRYRMVAVFLTGLMCVCACTNGCQKKENVKKPAQKQEETTKSDVRHNATDFAIVTSIDTNKQQITVQSIKDAGKQYVLNYFNGTSFQNKYGTELITGQIEPGIIVDLCYVSGTQKLISLKESDEAWENNKVTNWDADFDEKKMSIGGENYIYDEDLFVVSGKKYIDIENISGVDTLVVRGVGNKVYSINVSIGHGYIKLTDTANFIGGMVEVGGKIMTVITEDMIIAAPVGEYSLTAWKNGNGGTVTVNVKRDDEVYVSLSGFNGEIEKNGAVKFSVTPQDAQVQVYIDDVEKDITEVVDLEYGTHKLLITSDKYPDYTENFVVKSIYSNKVIDISGTSAEEETTTSADEKETGNVAADNKLTITKPEGASVYMDGVFKGTIPLTIKKEAGDHVIILRQTGYQSVVYNVSFSEDEKDESIYFPEMEKSTTGETK